MKMKKFLFVKLLGIMTLNQVSFAEDNTDAFVTAINQAWCSSNYIALKEVIDFQLQEDPGDILALGLNFVYYLNVIADDVVKTYESAQAYVMAVSNRMPSEIIYKRVPVNLAMAILETPNVTNFPPVQPNIPGRMEAIHTWFPDEYPFLEFYRSVPERIKKLEEGLITDEDLTWVTEAVWLGGENPPPQTATPPIEEQE